jgi:hypothetical protein
MDFIEPTTGDKNFIDPDSSILFPMPLEDAVAKLLSLTSQVEVFDKDTLKKIEGKTLNSITEVLDLQVRLQQELGGRQIVYKQAGEITKVYIPELYQE